MAPKWIFHDKTVIHGWDWTLKYGQVGGKGIQLLIGSTRDNLFTGSD
jgi:hypothetical protein